ncbi:tripartite tricarboxylate transporter TctB family protein [Bradyrhizobium prioriisuperbiae]|uniref:tripartite tricarboxylate transporter TctB family protein n=1 Tax=Bradyrhizobium prioriisuperbiae TaxID=2854389 RepID=UPI0028F15216|nr:tripartite tricarboxylate transporter TctB family protein [Bradyrhizobium prioritasuperba]
MISRHHLEAATAVMTGAFGAAVIVSSLDNGIGWSRAGVEAGTFPFMFGLLILAGSIINLVQGWIQGPYILLRRDDLKRLGALFIPAAVYVGAIPLLGIFLASAGYVLGALVWGKRASPLLALTVAMCTALALYLVFERIFQISLPRGLLGDALGL